MQRYDLGDTATLRHEVRDADGNLADATVALSVVPPGGVASAPVLTNPSTGIYDGALPVDAYGVYSFTWTVTGAVNDVVRGVFYVAAEDDDRLPPLASLDRLGRKLGYVPEGAEADRAHEILEEASELIRDAAGRTWVTEATGALTGVPRRIRTICVEVAYRAFTNPEGLSQRSIGDSSKSYDRASREGGEAVYLTKEERRDVLAAAGGSSLSSVTLVSPYSGDRGTLSPWDEVTAE